MKKGIHSLLTLLLILSLLTGCVPAAPAQQSRTTAAPESAVPELVLLTPAPDSPQAPEETEAHRHPLSRHRGRDLRFPG